MDLHQHLKYFYEHQRNSYAPKEFDEQRQVKVKMAHTSSQPELSQQAIGQVHRKIFNFIFVYAIIIVTLYLTYAAFYFYQHHNHSQQLLLQRQPEELPLLARSERVHQAPADEEPAAAKLEGKLHLLERYIELIALDLQETKERLREREKCDCNLGCTFNNTNYADNSSWRSQCDICSCKAGKISCAPQKCPATDCDVAVRLPGQCCPTCMKKCKHNNKVYQHGQSFSPSGSDQSKECKCDDGRIKCELRPASSGKQRKASLEKPAATATNRSASGSEQVKLLARAVPANVAGKQIE